MSYPLDDEPLRLKYPSLGNSTLCPFDGGVMSEWSKELDC